MKLVEGLCYTHPHYPDLVASHPVMRGVWRKCVSLLGKGVVMAPLLVDDRPQEGALCQQTVDDLLCATTSKTFQSFPWLGSPISEAELEVRYGILGCVALDVLYHLEVLKSVSALYPEWTWTVVHPVSFQSQQADMLAGLWLKMFRASNFEVMAQSLQIKKEVLLANVRASFLGRFTHHWIGENGRVISTTQPVWKEKRVLHEPVPMHISVGV